MRESTKRIAVGVYYITLGVSVAGVCIAGLGMLMEQDTLYYTGLVLASPLFVTVLPIGVVLLALMPVAMAYHLVTWLWSRILGGERRVKTEKISPQKERDTE